LKRNKRIKLSELVYKTQNGDEEAVVEIIKRFTPLINKYSRRMGYDAANSDLVLLLISALKKYRPNTTWGKDELDKYIKRINSTSPTNDDH